MPIACSFVDRTPITHPSDLSLPEADRTRFFVRPLKAKVRKLILSLATRDPVAAMYETVRHGIEFENFRDASGAEISSKLVKDGEFRVLPEAAMDALGPYWNWAAKRVVEINELDKDDQGNSQSSPASDADA